MMLTVVAWKWKGGTVFHGREYSAEHVNVLGNMLERNLTVPYEYVCITDDPEGIENARIVPMWDEAQEIARRYRECFCRLCLFNPDYAKDVGDRILSIDVDCVILGNIDHLVTADPFKIYRNPSLGRHNTRYAGGLWLMDRGAHPEVWDEFSERDGDDYRGYWKVRDLKSKHKYVGSDQAWLSHKIHDAPTWGTGDGVYSFRWDIRSRETRGSGGARLVFTHGSPSGPWKHEDPSDPDLQKEYPWIAEHWR